MAEWRTPYHLRDHCVRHRRLLRLRSVEAYDASARETIRVGTYFESRDPESGEPRVGYYDAASERLTGLTDDEAEIVTHFLCHERYVARTLPGSTYT
jgi:hypothetical protein